jgi:hypothetical protein
MKRRILAVVAAVFLSALIGGAAAAAAGADRPEKNQAPVATVPFCPNCYYELHGG